ncbi:MAG: DUF3179 domain-containing protein [Pseudomonadota bacterium]
MVIRVLAIGLLTWFGTVAMAEEPPRFWSWQWPQTNFDQRIIESFSEIRDGGPPKDGIPAVDDPRFISASDETRLGDREPVLTLALPGERARAYPIRYFMRHEIVNDVVGDRPVSVTYCPLCNSGMAFDRRVGDAVLDFGVSGKLRNSDMVMYDRQTESWWQQAIGTGIIGHYAGTELTQIPTVMESWKEFLVGHPDGLVLDAPFPGASYSNPYVNYDSSKRPFLYSGELPPHGILPLERVLRVGDSAWPLNRLAKEVELRESGLMITWNLGQASALDTGDINAGKEVGTVRVFDEAGNPVAHDILFAFAFHAFWPEGNWMLN